MASAFGHAYAGVMLGKILDWERVPVRFWVLSAACAILPDADALGFFLGVPYGSTFGHRGFTHSIVFAMLIGMLVALIFFREKKPGVRDWWIVAGYFFLVTLSHPLIDAMTNGGLGVAFFSPFSNERYFFSWRPIQVSPIGVTSFFNKWGAAVLLSETLWIGLPLFGAWLLSIAFRKFVSR